MYVARHREDESLSELLFHIHFYLVYFPLLSMLAILKKKEKACLALKPSITLLIFNILY